MTTIVTVFGSQIVSYVLSEQSNMVESNAK